MSTEQPAEDIMREDCDSERLQQTLVVCPTPCAAQPAQGAHAMTGFPESSLPDLPCVLLPTPGSG